jgi:glycosyltransferase involved in cell wall biosynthesis
MKVLFDHPQPFFLAHGGFQTHIEQTKRGLEQNGLQVEYVRWWDDAQRGDLIHFFSVARSDYLTLARRRRLPVIMTHLFSETCNRPNWKLTLQGAAIQALLKVPLFRATKAQLTWTAYRDCAHLTVGLQAEKEVLQRVYHVEPSMISVVPLGISEAYLKAAPATRQADHVICIGTITAQKRCVELAHLARAAQVPILFVGKPYHPSDPYWTEFQRLVDDKWVKYRSHVETEAQMISLLQEARGFVLYSRFENWSLSASEAVACGLPILVPNQKWSRERFGAEAYYFAPGGHRKNISILREFHGKCRKLPPPKVKLLSWSEVGERLRAIYAGILSSSR